MVRIKKSRDHYENSISVIIVASIIFLVTLFFARKPILESSLDANFIKYVYNWPISLRTFFYLVTQLVSVYVIAGGVILLWMRRHRVLAYTVASTSIFTFAFTEIVKILVRQPRPSQVLPNIVSRDSMAIGFGFPSGHAALSTLICVLLWSVVPKMYRWLLVVTVSLVCLSRIYLGVHSLLDIIGGICIGLIIGLVVKLPMLKLKQVLQNGHTKHKLNMEV